MPRPCNRRSAAAGGTARWEEEPRDLEDGWAFPWLTRGSVAAQHRSCAWGCLSRSVPRVTRNGSVAEELPKQYTVLRETAVNPFSKHKGSACKAYSSKFLLTHLHVSRLLAWEPICVFIKSARSTHRPPAPCCAAQGEGLGHTRWASVCLIFRMTCRTARGMDFEGRSIYSRGVEARAPCLLCRLAWEKGKEKSPVLLNATDTFPPTPKKIELPADLPVRHRLVCSCQP